MGDKSLNYTPFAVDDGRSYSDRVKVHHRIIDTFTPTVLWVLDKIEADRDRPFALADFGTADGGTSYALVTQCVRHLAGVKGITDLYRNVFVLASGTSFYSLCLPPNSAHLIFCFTSIHCPHVRCDGLFPMETSGTGREEFETQAEKDWENFLLLRVKELRKGGYLVVTTQSMETADDVKTHVSEVHGQVSKLWKSLWNDQLITEEEFQYTNFGMYFRSKEELEKPFIGPETKVRKAGLSLLQTETKVVSCPFQINGKRDSNGIYIKDRRAQSLSDARRAWQEATLRQGLTAHRPSEEIDQILDEFYRRYTTVIEKAPELLSADFVIHCVVIAKE